MDDDPVGPDGPCRHRGAVEHQVRGVVEQVAVLAAGWLSFRPVGDDDRLGPARPGHGTPLDPHRKPGATVAAQSALLHGIEEGGCSHNRKRPPASQVGIEVHNVLPAGRVEQAVRPGGCAHRSPSPLLVPLPVVPAVPVTLPVKAPERWSIWRLITSVSGPGAFTRAVTVPPFRPTTVP